MDELKQLCRELNQVLQQEEKCLKATASALLKDRKALISAKSSYLEKAANTWSDLAAKREDLDRRRVTLVDRISKITGLPTKAVRVSRLASIIGGLAGKELKLTGERVQKAAREAAIQASVGRELLANAAQFQEDLISRLVKATNPELDLYGRQYTDKSTPVSMINRMG